MKDNLEITGIGRVPPKNRGRSCFETPVWQLGKSLHVAVGILFLAGITMEETDIEAHR